MAKGKLAGLLFGLDWGNMEKASSCRGRSKPADTPIQFVAQLFHFLITFQLLSRNGSLQGAKSRINIYISFLLEHKFPI